MTKLVGTVRRDDLAGGLWILETDDGDRYQLRGAVADLADGIKASVEGKVEKDVMGIGMVGPTFKIDKVTRL